MNEHTKFSNRVREHKMYNAKSCSSFDNERLIENFANECLQSYRDIRSIISQKSAKIKIRKCKSVPTSLNRYENDDTPMLVDEKVEMRQIEKCKDDKIVSSGIIEKTENNLKEENVHTYIENTRILEGMLEIEKLSEKPKRRKRAFSLLDVFLSVSIIGPLAIGFWRGVWTWMDLHAELFPGWFCFTFGAVLHVIYTVFKNRFHDTYVNKWAKLSARKRLPYRILRILYTHTFGVACITHWRGGWIIIDAYLLTHVWITTCLMCLLLACLAILRCVRNLIATPMIILIDRPSYVFQFPTRYNVISFRMYCFALCKFTFDPKKNNFRSFNDSKNGLKSSILTMSLFLMQFRCHDHLCLALTIITAVVSLITAREATDPVLNCQTAFI